MEPGRLDSLWLEILASDYGHALLNAWDITLEQVLSCRPTITGEPEDVVGRASSMVALTALSPYECAEYMLCGLLASSQSSLCQTLRAKGEAVDLLLSRFTEELWRNPARTRVDMNDWFLKAYRKGRVHPHEADLLEVCAQASVSVGQWLARHQVPIDQLQCRQVEPVDWTVEFIETVHLTLALSSHWPEIVHWMEDLGITAWRLRCTIHALDPRLSNPQVSGQRLSWLKPACEEARLLNALEVTPQHLLLGLLSDPEGLTCRLMRQHGVELGTLRRQLSEFHPSPVVVSKMTFSPELLEICQEAARRDGPDPHPGELLELVLETLKLGPESLKADLRVRLKGSLIQDSRRLSVHGIALGMSAEEVLERCGPPLLKDNDTWYFESGLVVVLVDGKVTQLVGGSLQQDGATVLDLQAGPDQVERLLGVHHEALLKPGEAVRAHLGRGDCFCAFFGARSEARPE